MLPYYVRLLLVWAKVWIHERGFPKIYCFVMYCGTSVFFFHPVDYLFCEFLYISSTFSVSVRRWNWTNIWHSIFFSKFIDGALESNSLNQGVLFLTAALHDQCCFFPSNGRFFYVVVVRSNRKWQLRMGPVKNRIFHGKYRKILWKKGQQNVGERW